MMKLLKTFLVLSAVVLGGCETPPKPKAFPNTSEQSTIVNPDSFLLETNNAVPKNQLDKGAWQYTVSIYPNQLKNNDYHAQFWYMAHHADNIVIVGSHNNINNLRYLFLSSGTTKNIELTPTCYESKRNKCNALMNIYFYKHENVSRVVSTSSEKYDLNNLYRN